MFNVILCDIEILRACKVVICHLGVCILHNQEWQLVIVLHSKEMFSSCWFSNCINYFYFNIMVLFYRATEICLRPVGQSRVWTFLQESDPCTFSSFPAPIISANSRSKYGISFPRTTIQSCRYCWLLSNK